MKVKVKLLSASPVREGVSRMGNAYKACDVLVQMGERMEDVVSASALNEVCDLVSGYNFTLKPEMEAELSFMARDSYSYNGRKYNEVSLRSLTALSAEGDKAPY